MMEKSKYDDQYLPADKKISYHKDDDILYKVKIKLPEPPPLQEIDGYGKRPKNQFFKPPVVPPRLISLEKSSETIDDVWHKLNYYYDSYVDEIAFIKREWDRRIHGYWCFIDGKPTYIDGWHYMYLSYWNIDVGLPEYRSRDRGFFLFARHTFTTTTAYYSFRVYDRNSDKTISYFYDERDARRFLQDKDPTFIGIQKSDFYLNIGRRLCYGFNYPKHRREGATYKADCILYCVISTTERVHGGIQSMDGTSAGKAFTKAVVKPWKKLPFFFKPRYAGSTDPKTRMEFDVGAQKIGSKGSLMNIATGLESEITWADSASRSWYDGDKLKFLHNDEVGKTVLEDVRIRHGVQKKCLAQGNGVFIHGLEINTSTVGEMAEKGGDAFFRLCDSSHYERRNKLGQTQSGLFNLFIPAYDGLEGFIDIFGNSIIDDPDEKGLWRWPMPIRDADGNLIGARRYLEEILDEILNRDDEESIKEYEEEIRLHPTSFSQCFITAGSGSGLDIKKVIRRIKELRFDKSITKRGNLRWKNGDVDSEVEWYPDQVNGRFIISLDLEPNERNQKIKTTIKDIHGNNIQVWRPLRPWVFTAGADPYKFRKTEGRRVSKGAGSVFFERNKTIDPDNKPVEQWQTYRTVCTYTYRPFDPDEYAEDMLMMCVWFGAMMFPEINIPLIWDHFVRRGYDGYLKYGREPNGQWRKTPGFNMRGAYPQKLMQLHQNYIANFWMNERHIEILESCKNIKGIEDITNHDLFTAVGAAYIGSETDYGLLYDDMDGGTKGVDISVFYK